MAEGTSVSTAKLFPPGGQMCLFFGNDEHRSRSGYQKKGLKCGIDHLKYSGPAAPQHSDPSCPHLTGKKVLGQVQTFNGPGINGNITCGIY